MTTRDVPLPRTLTVDERNNVSTLAARTDYLRACATRGVSFGGDDRAFRMSRQAVTRFLDEQAE